MDQFVIKTPGLRLVDDWLKYDYRQQLAGRPIRKYDAPVHLVPGDYELFPCEGDDGTSYMRVTLGPGGSIRIFARKEQDEWYARKIEGNLAKLLYGFNAVPIDSNLALQIGLTRLQHVVGWLVPPEFRSRIIPGLGKNNESYWDLVALPVDLPDPNLRIFTSLQHMRHPGIRKAALKCDRESYKIKGEKKSINVYRKDVEVAARYGQTANIPDGPIVRIECEWKGIELANRARSHGGWCRRSVDDSSEGKLISFTHEILYAMHRAMLAETKGVFLGSKTNDKPQKSARGSARLLAEIAKSRQIALHELLELDTRCVKRSTKTRADLRREAEAHLEGLQEIQLEEFLPTSFPHPPYIDIPGLRYETDLFCLPGLPSAEIAKAYGEPNDSRPDSFNPYRLFHASQESFHP